jgi:hypothetical protein
MEAVGDAMAVEPDARFLHRIAILDTVDGDGHEMSPCLPRVIVVLT